MDRWVWFSRTQSPAPFLVTVRTPGESGTSSHPDGLLPLAKPSILSSLIIFVLAGWLLGCHSSMAGPTPTPTTEGQAPCWSAAVRAVEEEIHRYQTWLSQTTDPNQQALYRKALTYLKDLHQRLQAPSLATPPWEMTWRFIPEVEQGSYGRHPLPPPDPILLMHAWLERPLPAWVHFAGQTRSGPFYLATGTQGTLSVQPGISYRLLLQPLIPRTYPFPSYYVCILQAEPLPETLPAYPDLK